MVPGILEEDYDRIFEMSISVTASLLSANFLRLGEDIKQSEKSGISGFHLDVMDGHMAPNLSYGPPVIKAIRRATSFFLDTHLMIDNPWLFFDDYIAAGTDGLLIHAEAYDLDSWEPRHIQKKARSTKRINTDKLRSDLISLRTRGMAIGITLNLLTPISLITPLLPLCDSVLLMSIDPGYSGQTFNPTVLPKIRELRAQYTGPIKIDGGISPKTAPAVIDAGATELITASYLYGSNDYAEAVKRLIPDTTSPSL